MEERGSLGSDSFLSLWLLNISYPLFLSVVRFCFFPFSFCQSLFQKKKKRKDFFPQISFLSLQLVPFRPPLFSLAYPLIFTVTLHNSLFHTQRYQLFKWGSVDIFSALLTFSLKPTLPSLCPPSRTTLFQWQSFLSSFSSSPTSL